MGQYLNLSERLYNGAGRYNVPEIFPTTDYNVTDWIGFNYVKCTKKDKSKTGVNFFLDDYQFERCWNNPNRYAQLLSEFGCVLSPDFSLYTDFPKAIQIYNHYRNQWLGRYWQENGLTVIPTISWSDKESYDWCFDGVPENSIVAISNVGCMMNKVSRQLFMDGYNEMLTRLQPKEILMFAHKMDDYKGNVTQIKFSMAKGEQGG